MKLITRDTDYAVRALCYLAKAKNGMVTVNELVGALQIPRPFLRKILQQLNKKKIVCSYKGKNGGFRLAVSPQKIFLLDLICVLQGAIELNECSFKKKSCPNAVTCVLRKKIKIVEKNMLAQIEAISVASLLI